MIFFFFAARCECGWSTFSPFPFLPFLLSQSSTSSVLLPSSFLYTTEDTFPQQRSFTAHIRFPARPTFVTKADQYKDVDYTSLPRIAFRPRAATRQRESACNADSLLSCTRQSNVPFFTTQVNNGASRSTCRWHI